MVDMDTIVSLCKRRGFVFQSSEIYGGLASTYAYGPLGIEMKRNIRDSWWRTFINGRDDCVGIESAILMHPQVWVTSGHLASFSDPLVECRTCHRRFREDHLDDGSKCPECDGELTDPRQFNMMLKTFLGPIEDGASQVYLRPETAQGIFVNFQNVLNSTRRKLPFGIGQIGKSFRNEITVGNFIFRTREFEQMELEFFVPPDEANDWYQYWMQERHQWYLALGIPEEQIRLRPHDDDELSHYSSGTSDIEFLFPWGWGELEGIANRGDFDLTQHAQHSGQKLEYFDQGTGERYVPHCIEPAAGATRSTMAFLMAAYDEEQVNDDTRTVLRLHPRLAPYKVAVLPLSKKDTLLPKAEEVLHSLQPHFMCDYDITQAIGKRYRRQDEIGTPYCVTIDFDTLEDNAVTVRERDSMEQQRIPVDQLVNYLDEQLAL